MNDSKLEEIQEPMSFRRVRFKLEAAGFNEIKQLGNHAKFVKRKDGKIITAILPHYQELSVTVVRSIIRQARMTKSEFDQY